MSHQNNSTAYIEILKLMDPLSDEEKRGVLNLLLEKYGFCAPHTGILLNSNWDWWLNGEDDIYDEIYGHLLTFHTKKEPD
jgi:hypothetical protein